MDELDIIIRDGHIIPNETSPDPDLANILDIFGEHMCNKFESTRETSYLDRAVEIAHEAIEATPLCSELWPIRLQNLGTRVFVKFKHTQTLADLEEAIFIFQGIIDATSPDATATLLFGWLLGTRFSMTGNVADLDRAINITRDAIDIILPNDPKHPVLLSFLADQLMHRHDVTMDVTDIDEAICLGQNLINATPPNHPKRAGRLIDLADSFCKRYLSTEDISDLNEAISLAQEANEATPLDDACLVKTRCGMYLWSRYQRAKEIADLEEAIYMFFGAVETDPKDKGWWNEVVDILLVAFNLRYISKFDAADINTSIIIFREIIAAIPLNDTERAQALTIMARALKLKYSNAGEAADLDEAICITGYLLNATSLDNDSRVQHLIRLASYLNDRHTRTGSQSDREESILLMRHTIEATPEDNPNLTDMFCTLAKSLIKKYFDTGSLRDLDEVISMVQDCLYAKMLPGYEARIELLHLLGSCLHYRYDHTRAMSDLEDSITMNREAIDTAPAYYSIRSDLLLSLGRNLMVRYYYTNTIANLNEAISLFQEALETATIPLIKQCSLLHNVSVALSTRFSRSEEIADLMEAIAISREAIVISPKGGVIRAQLSSGLGEHLRKKYVYAGTRSDLDEAIRVCQDAVNTIPLAHPGQAQLLIQVGIYLTSRSHHMKALAEYKTAALAIISADPVTASLKFSEAMANARQPGSRVPEPAIHLLHADNDLLDPDLKAKALLDIETARQCFIDALYHEPAEVHTRFAAGSKALISPDIIYYSEAYDVAKATIDLIPSLTSRSLQLSDKQNILSGAVGTSSVAAAIALHALPANRGPFAAIECLETGRGLIGGSLFQQYEISTLRNFHPELADSFLVLRDRLDMPTLQASSPVKNDATLNIEVEGDGRRKTEQQFSNLLDVIRSRPGFQRFLLSASELDMLHAASDGPLIILNMYIYRSDALIIEPSGFRVVELPHLSQGHSSVALIDKYLNDLESLETLAWLWDAIVCPVLDALGFTGPPIDDSWPHVWWIPTGALTKFPLHAAGHHLRRSGETTLDRVISSYATSVKAIIHSRQRGAPSAMEPPSLIAVAMEATEGHKPLIHANREVDAIFNIFESKMVRCHRPQPYKDDVLSAMKTCQMFHFAGHGETHLTDPLSSALLLRDWQNDPLTVTSLLETDPSSNQRFLAYLSACGTGQIHGGKYTDESIHLVNAFQLAGYRHVIGTLWRVDDELCVEIAEMTYKSLRGGIRDDLVSRGLHDAIRALRDRWIDMVDEGDGSESCVVDGFREGRHAQLDDDEKLGRPLWIPYVHFGV